MANKVDELEVLIKANTEQFNAGLKNVESKINAFQSGANKVGKAASVATSAVGTAIGMIATKAFSAISSQIDGAISRLDTLNNYSKVMSNLGISTSVSSASVTKLSDALQGLPTNLSDAVSSVQRFTAINNSLEYSTDAYLALNNAILASGASTQMQASALEQLTQAYSKGKPEMQDWKTAIQTMPAQLKQIGLAMGYASTTQLYDALQSGEITMQDFMNTVLKLNTEGVAGFASFSDQARTATGGVQTSITNLKIAFQRGLASIMETIGQTNISGFINNVASAIGTVANYISAFIRLIKQAVAWIGALFGGSGSTENLVKETKSASDSMAGVASGASDVAGGLSDANGQAKKLKHTLAGFDEMNVLTEQETGGGSGGSGGGAGGGIDMSNYTWDTSALQNSSDKVGEIVDKIKDKFKGIIEWLKKSRIGQALESVFPEWKKSTERWLPEIVKNIQRLAGNISQPFMALGGIIGDIISGIFDSIATVIETRGAEIYDNFLGFVNSILDFINNLWEQQIWPFLEPIFTGISNAWNKYIQPLVTKIATLIASISNLVMVFWNNFLKPLLDEIVDFFAPAVSFIGDVIGGAIEFVSGLFSGFFGWFLDSFQGLIDFLTKIFQGDWEGAWNSIQDTVKKFQEDFDRIWQAIKDFFTNIINAIVDSFKREFDNIQQKAQESRDKIFGFFSGVGQWFKDRFNEAKNAITGVFSNIGQWFGDRWNDIKNVFSNVWSVFSNIGRNIWEGLKSGIGNIAQKMKDMFTGAVDAVKNFLGIHSPSKLFAQLGGYVSEGFANGIESEYDRVQDAFKEMAMVDTDDIVTESTLNINSSIGEDLNEIENKPISLLLKIDGESIPISAERIADTINDASFLMNKNVLNI